MILRLIACVFLVVLILYTATMLAEKIRDILEEGNYKKMCEQYLSQTWQVLKRIEDLDSFSKRLEKFETDFWKTGLQTLNLLLNTGRTLWQVLAIQRSLIRKQNQKPIPNQI